MTVLLLELAPIAAPPTQQATPPSAPAVPPVTAPIPGPAPTGIAVQAQETHGDWRVVCASPNNQKICAFSQQLSDKSSGQRVLGIEVRAAADGRLTASIVMPFGVAVDKPVTIRVDEASPMSVPFKTCIPLGCVVTTTWEASTVAALRKGTAVLVSTLSADTGQTVSFRIPLNGFGTALDRSIALAKP
jgi:invasion protein IalB